MPLSDPPLPPTRALRRTLHALPWLIVALAWGVPGHAAGTADDKRACAEASEEAQLLRIHGKLRAARDQLFVCARDACPPLVKHDCEQWLAEVDASMPTVVISATDASGHDVADVQVRADDEPFLDKLTGAAVALDAGEHVLRFKHGDDPPIEQRVIVKEGEKNRQIEVKLQPIVALVPPAVVVPERPVIVERGGASGGMTILGLSLLGAGAVALGLGTYFEIDQASEYSTLKNGCSLTNNCKQSDVDTIANNRIYAGVFLGVGGAAAAAGAIVLLTRKRGDAGPARARGSWFDVTPTPGGAAAFWHGSF